MSANRPYIIGLTGGIGTGKSEAAKFLASLGAVHLDADAISHELTKPGGEALERRALRLKERSVADHLASEGVGELIPAEPGELGAARGLGGGRVGAPGRGAGGGLGVCRGQEVVG